MTIPHHTEIRRAPTGRQDRYIPHMPVVVGDASQRRIKATVNTPDRDRYHTIIDPRGMRVVPGPIALLFNHDHRQPAGRITDIIRSDDAVEIEAVITSDTVWSHVRSGAVTGMSIGFSPDEWRAIEGDSDTLVCTSWELCEISLASVPANPQAVIQEIRSMPPMQPAPRVTDRTSQQPIDERALTTALSDALGTQPQPTARLVGQTSLARPAVHTMRAQPFNVGRVWASMLGDTHLDGMELEVTQELAKRAPPSTDRGGMRIPWSVFRGKHALATRQISTDPGSVGALSPTAYLAELLDDTATARRWGALLPRLGFREVTTSRESVDIPKRDSRLVASWGPKDTDAAASEWTADSDNVRPTYIKCTVTLQRSALKYPDPSALAITIEDIGDAIDDGADTGVLYGTGQNDQPTGLLTNVPGGNITNLNGQPASSQNLFDLKNMLITAWRMDQGDSSMRWLMNARSYDALRITSKKSGAPDNEWYSGITPFDTAEGLLLGIPAVQSGKVLVKANPANSYDIDLIYGRMGVVVWFAGGSIDTIIDTSTLSNRGAARISAFLDCHCVRRDPNIVYRLGNVLASPPTGNPLTERPPSRGGR